MERITIGSILRPTGRTSYVFRREEGKRIDLERLTSSERSSNPLVA